MVPSIARTAGFMVFGLRLDQESSMMANNHIGCIDRSPFIATGSAIHLGSEVYTQVTYIDAEHDFPEPVK